MTGSHDRATPTAPPARPAVATQNRGMSAGDEAGGIGFADNPFLQNDLRRWRRRGYLWKVPLGIAGLPALGIVILHALVAYGPEPVREVLQSRFSVLLLSTVASLHALAVAISTGLAGTLNAEAAADRLDFLRLVPLTPRELMGKLAAARAVLRIGPVVMGLPVYVVAMAYGGTGPADLAGLYFIFALFLFAVPGWIEVQGALCSRIVGVSAGVQGGPGAGPGAARQNVAPAIGIWLAIQGSLSGLLQPLIRLGIPILRRLAQAAGPGYAVLLPLTALPLAGRLMMTPLPFFSTRLAPALVVFCYAVLRTASRWVASAELWTREPVAFATAEGGRAGVLAEGTGRPADLVVLRRLELLQAVVLGVGAAGFLWEPGIQSGALGRLVGSSTAEGGAAALLLVWVGWRLLVQFERVRGRLHVRDEASPAGEAALAVMSVFGPAAIVALIVALPGGISLWPNVLLALTRLFLLLAGALVLGHAWSRRFSGLVLEGPHAGVGSRAKRLRATKIYAATLFWIAVYLGPLFLLRSGRSELWLHGLVAWSPLYGVLSLLPGLWRRPPPMPGEIALLIPGAVGVLLMLTRGRAQQSGGPARKPGRRRDPLERAFARWAERWDNPFLCLRLARQARRPFGLTWQTLGILLSLLAWTAFILYFPATAMAARRGVPLAAVLSRPAVGEVSYTGVLGMGAAGFLVVVLGFGVAIRAHNSSVLECALARAQGRRQDLLACPISGRELVAGLLAVSSVEFAPAVVGVTTAGLLCLGLAISGGTPWWWVPVWLGGVGTALLCVAHGALAGVRKWEPPPRWSRVVTILIWIAVTAGFIALPFRAGLVISAVRGLMRGWEIAVVVLPSGGLLVAGALLPIFWRRTVAAINRVRREPDLEARK